MCLVDIIVHFGYQLQPVMRRTIASQGISVSRRALLYAPGRGTPA